MKTINEIKEGKENSTMQDIKNELIERMTDYSVSEERLMCLVELAAHMMGKINCDCVSDNEEIKKDYPGWLESLLDTVAELAKKQTFAFDAFIQNVNELEEKQNRTD